MKKTKPLATLEYVADDQVSGKELTVLVTVNHYSRASFSSPEDFDYSVEVRDDDNNLRDPGHALGERVLSGLVEQAYQDYVFGDDGAGEGWY